MTAAPPSPPRAPSAPPPPGRTVTAHRVAPKFSTADVAFTPPAIVFNAVEGFGKTSYIAYAPNAAILMARGERGYTTLLGAGRVPKIPHVSIDSWADALAVVDGLADDPQGIKFLGFDALGGFERLCHEYVCNRDFGGDWGEKGFGSFQKGYEVSVTEWLKLLVKLDALRDRHGIAPVMLSHSKVATFKNPDGADFDRYVSDVHQKTWAATAKWADLILFGKFFTVVQQKDNNVLKKGKGIGGTDRVVYTERRDAWDAKNRYGLPPEIDMPNDPSQMWQTVWSQIRPG